MMKVWELIAKLSDCPAGANVNVGISQTLNVAATDFEYDEGDCEVIIRSSEDVEVACESGSKAWLSVLADDQSV